MHAKWSPVSTASYRLLPEINFLEQVVNDEAEKLVSICPMNVFELETKKKSNLITISQTRWP